MATPTQTPKHGRALSEPAGAAARDARGRLTRVGGAAARKPADHEAALRAGELGARDVGGRIDGGVRGPDRRLLASEPRTVAEACTPQEVAKLYDRLAQVRKLGEANRTLWRAARGRRLDAYLDWQDAQDR